MDNSKFEYPIYPDRVYTLTTDLVKYKVYGSVLIKAYLAYIVKEKHTDLSTDTLKLSTDLD